MSKKGVSAVSGIISPVIGEKNIYNITSWYPATPIADRNPAKVTWELFKKRSNGKFTTTNNKKVGRSDFTFGQTAAGETYRLEAYLYNAEGGGLIITPKPAKIPKINKVELFYVDDTKGTLFSYMERLRAKANCVNMLGKELVFTLWEDDAKDGGHNDKNLPIATQKARVNKSGLATVDFSLTMALMLKASRGEQDGQLEFYVTVEYYKNNKHATNNVNVKGIPISPPKEQPKPKVLPKAKGSPAESKPASKKEEVGILETISKKWDELWDWAEGKGTATNEKPPTVEKPEGKSTTVVKEVKVEKKDNSKCECEQYDLVWGKHPNVSCEFRKKVIEISKRQNFDPNHLMAVMKVESAGTFSPSKIELVITGYRNNGKAIKEYKPLSKDDILKKDENFGGAVGLIQFTPVAITELNKAYSYKLTKRKLALMSQLEQLNYVEDYIKFWKKANNIRTKLTLADLYLVVFAPGKMNGSDVNTTLYAKGTEYYNANASVDTDGKNGITKKEIASRAYASLAEGALERENNFECGSSIEENATGKSDSNWHEPVDNPICTLYMQSGGGGKKTVGEHWGLFGKTRNGSTHQGLDLFVIPDSNVYACTDGVVHKVSWHNGYGNTMTIKITDKESFYNHRREYSLLHASNGEIIQGNNFDKTKDIFLFYAHLNEVLLEEGTIVEAGKVIAKSGVSGVKTGTAAPHLHFEIFTTIYAVGKGLNYRCNPGFYVHFKSPNEQSQAELGLQNKTSKSKIDNFYGKK